MSKKDSKEQQKFISLIFRRKEVFKHLNTGYIDERVSCIREYVENTYFYTAVFSTIFIIILIFVNLEKLACLI